MNSHYPNHTLLRAEWQRHGRVDLPAFWLRRARRLLPALFVAIGAALALAASARRCGTRPKPA